MKSTEMIVFWASMLASDMTTYWQVEDWEPDTAGRLLGLAYRTAHRLVDAGANPNDVRRLMHVGG